jgi:hypothetical protein
MQEAVRTPLAAWESFYVIVGSSGAALTGLQFVVIALIAESKQSGTIREVETFGTPNVVNFSAVLLVSAILSAPWLALSNTALAIGACGVGGLIYTGLIIMRTQHLIAYRPVLEDWVWFIVLPLIAFALLLVEAFFLSRYPQRILFLVGATVLLLLFIGIHNAWDSVTYIAVGDSPKVNDSEQSGEHAESHAAEKS